MNELKKNQKLVKKRIENEKVLLLEQFKKTPIVQLACEKTGIGRATYYRWKKEDAKFSDTADAAILEGSLLVNDMAESQLLSSIKDKNMTAIIFWLKHHHPAYETRVEIRAAFNKSDAKLTARQEEIMRELLKITSSDETLKLEGGSSDETNK